MKILVPLDRSRPAERVIETVKQFAELTGAEVILCTVLDQRDRGSWREGERELVQEYLAGLGEQHFPSARTRTHESSTTVRGILEVIDLDGVDFVIMSSHGRTGAPEQAIGSVARDLVRTATVPVMLVGLAAT